MATLGCEPDAESAQPLMQQGSGEAVEKAFDDGIARRFAAEDVRGVGERDIHDATEAQVSDAMASGNPENSPLVENTSSSLIPPSECQAAGVRIKNETPGVQACETIRDGTCTTVLGISAEVRAAMVFAADAAMNESDRTVVAENQQHHIGNRYALKREPNTMGDIAALSEVICDEESNSFQAGVVKSETNRGIKRERELEMMQVQNLETKFEEAHQPKRRIKCKTKKDERKREKHEGVKLAPGVKRFRLKKKTEVKRKSEDTTVVEVIRPRKEGLTPLTCTERSVLWEKACEKFNREKRTWLPHRPCCFPNFWLDDRIPVRSNWTSCWSKMNPKQRDSLRRFVAADLEPICEVHNEAVMREWTKLYAPEVEASQVPVGRNPRGPYDPLTPSYMKLYPWMRDIPKRSWIGMGWITSPEGCWMIHTSCGAPKGQIFEGQGKRAASEVIDKNILDSIHEHHEDPRRLGKNVAKDCKHQPEPCGGMSQCPTTGRVLRTNLRSHVRNISWQQSKSRWLLQWMCGNRSMKKQFSVSKYKQGGDSLEEGIEKSFQAAFAARKLLLDQGLLKGELYQKPSKAPYKAEFQSSVAGVSWFSKGRYWRASVTCGGEARRLVFRTENDTPEEIERCRLAAEEACNHPSMALAVAKAPKNVDLQSSVAGVSWEPKMNRWKACLRRGNVRRELKFAARSSAPEEIERCRLLAEEARRQMELGVLTVDQ